MAHISIWFASILHLNQALLSLDTVSILDVLIIYFFNKVLERFHTFFYLAIFNRHRFKQALIYLKVLLEVIVVQNLSSQIFLKLTDGSLTMLYFLLSSSNVLSKLLENLVLRKVSLDLSNQMLMGLMLELYVSNFICSS